MVVIETARVQWKLCSCNRRFEPFQLNGKIVHEVGVIWNFGYHGLATGDSANLLTAHIGDANTMIPEYKAFLCDVHKMEGGAA
jgi:formate dehydrogenase major subunit